MLGAIAGDMIGSIYEFDAIKTREFPLFHRDSFFTDDTVLTVATMEVLMEKGDYAETYRRYFRAYPDRGYGGRFHRWAKGEFEGPYNSFGNGSAMRVSPVGWHLDTLEGVLAEAKRSAEVTHNHPEGIKGAQAVAAVVFMARNGVGMNEMRTYVEKKFGYDMSRTVDEIRPAYAFDETCQGSVPQALTAFLEAEGFEDAVRNAVSIGGDTDTIAAIAGSVAEAAFGMPGIIKERVLDILDPDLRETVERFYKHLGKPIFMP